MTDAQSGTSPFDFPVSDKVTSVFLFLPLWLAAGTDDADSGSPSPQCWQPYEAGNPERPSTSVGTKAFLPRVHDHINSSLIAGDGPSATERSKYLVLADEVLAKHLGAHNPGFVIQPHEPHSDGTNPGGGRTWPSVAVAGALYFEFDVGVSASRFLALQFTIVSAPPHNHPVGSWTVRDVNKINHTLLSTNAVETTLGAALGDLMKSTGLGGFKIHHPGATALVCTLIERMENQKAGTEEHQTAAVVLCEQLASGMPVSSTDGTRRYPMGRPKNDKDLPIGVHQRDENIYYSASYTGAAVIAVEDPGNRYVNEVLFNDTRRYLSFLWAYAVHQRSALIHLGERIANSDLVSRGGRREAEMPITTETTARIELIEHDFQRLLTWSRSRQVSSRWGIQSFYNFVHEVLRLDDHESEVSTALTSTSRLINVARARAEQQAEAQQERQLWLFGAAFTILSTGASLFGLLLSEKESFGLGRGDAIGATVLLQVVVFAVLFSISLTRKRRGSSGR